jgi:hypothetical protein
MPLIAYNASSNLATFRANSSFDLAQLPIRLHALRVPWDGQILWGLVHAPWSTGAPRVPRTAVEGIAALEPLLCFARGFTRAHASRGVAVAAAAVVSGGGFPGWRKTCC